MRRAKDSMPGRMDGLKLMNSRREYGKEHGFRLAMIGKASLN
jgi:hypothetical protein